MPDPIANPLAYLQVLSDRSKRLAATADIESSVASTAAAASQSPLPSASVTAPIVDAALGPVIKQESAEEMSQEIIPAVSVKAEVQRTSAEEASAPAEPMSSSLHQPEPMQTTGDEVAGLVQVKEQPMDTDTAAPPKPVEPVPSGSVPVKQEVVACTSSAEQDDLAAPISVQEEPVAVQEEPVTITSGQQQQTVPSGPAGGEPISAGSEQDGEPTQTGSVQIKLEPMDTTEPAAGDPAASGAVKVDTSGKTEESMEDSTGSSEQAQAVTEATRGDEPAETADL